ncbi:unnamed protein product [Adineta steineri]|uniref:NAD(P)(+)--arginine ADP-ribosyltransferase n=1 Tax=Adineta steineri TaxID=433720 RepID=A0A819A0I6_9BILA|nr:unnamed protein product [Adineta steineri]CAF3772636.1 unnamed protein product [Adineta steineri]
MSGSEFNQETSVSSNPFMNSNNTTIRSSDVIEPRRRLIQNYSILWLEECMDEARKDYESIWTKLKIITDNINVFKQRDECIDFLTDAQDIECFLIVENATAQQIMLLINDIPQLNSAYVFSNLKSLHEEPTKKWRKVKSVHVDIDDLCQGLQQGIKQYNQNSVAVSFIPVNEIAPTDNLNQLDPTFMYTQIFKDILVNMEHDKQAIKQFIAYCRHHDCGSSKNIDQFEQKYDAASAIWWYTSPSFIYSMLNYALRSMVGDTIINMGFFVHDLHQQILQLHQQQVNSYHGKSFIVYRGQGLTKPNFEKLKKAEGGLMSFNNFLSTSKNKEVSIGYADIALTEPDKVGILFIMSVDPCIKSAPFAFIKEISYFREEDEILFSMHTVFRVGTVKQMENKSQLYQVELQLTSDDDEQLRLLSDRIREETLDSTGWQGLSHLLVKIGQFSKAEELYTVLLEQSSDQDEKAIYYHQLEYIKNDQGDYGKAIWYAEQALEIYQKTLPSNHPNLAPLYNNIGLAYDKMGDYSKTLSYYEKALEIRQITFPSNHPDLANSYNNIGGMHCIRGEYLKALTYYEQALEICQKTLPSNHPDLATSYNNIGSAYYNMREYLKTLRYYEKALEISQKALSPNHPDLAISYNNIGSAYQNMGEYSKALSFLEKALEIYQKTFPSNHPHLAISYNNIGGVYDSMDDYSKALSFYEKAFEIYQKTLPANHFYLAASYSNIGSVYDNMGDYSQTLLCYEKALEIFQKTLSVNHPDSAALYNHIGSVYKKLGENLKAVSFLEKALEIYQKSLPYNHPDLTTLYNNIGLVYAKMGEYLKALTFCEKALEIKEKTLPSNHPDLATLYNNIAGVYYNMEDYSKALSYFERALDIWQRALHPTHPHIKMVKGMIEIIKKRIYKENLINKQ